MALTIETSFIAAMAKALADDIDQNILNTITTTAYDEYPIYTDGTKLLRDAAQAAEDYQYKKSNSRSGWKTRYEIRNV